MIIHVDMDAFYASVEQRDFPELRGLPIAVGGRPDRRGVISAASYEARTFGVRSAMPSYQALVRCPELIIRPGRMTVYVAVSRQIREIFHKYTPMVEPLSLDEAYLDTQGSEKLYGDAVTIGRAIKAEIAEQLQLCASVGIAPNKFLAKIASDYDKPDGFCYVSEARIDEFLLPLSIRALPGVGKKTQQKLLDQGLDTVAKVRQLNQRQLVDLLGKSGLQVYRFARGHDARKVVIDSDTKSISHELTLDQDITDLNELSTILSGLCEAVAFRLRRQELLFRTVTLKIRLHDFSRITRSVTLSQYSHDTAELLYQSRQLLSHWHKVDVKPVRLIGVAVSQLSASPRQPRADHVQMDLFSAKNKLIVPQEKLDKKLDIISDDIRQRFGKSIIQRARSIKVK